jgi:hypothetical protein
MSKNLRNVFILVGVLVLIFLVWQLFFNDGGILQKGWNALVGVVNNTWNSLAGGSDGILPTWGDANVETDGQNLKDATNNSGF